MPHAFTATYMSQHITYCSQLLAGEGQLMSWDEHVMLIAHTVNTFGSQLQVIGNTGSNSTREALHATEQGFAVGMDAALQINPYYGKTSLDGLMAHFTAVLHEGPTIIYNVPSRTGTALTTVPHHVYTPATQTCQQLLCMSLLMTLRLGMSCQSRQGLLQGTHIHCQVLGLQSDVGNAVCQALAHD